MENPAQEERMRKVVVSMNVALDGVIEAPERWSFQFWSGELAESANEEPLGSDALPLGRLNYGSFAAFWPTATNEPGIPARMNGLTKYVASTALKSPWSGAPRLRSAMRSTAVPCWTTGRRRPKGIGR